MPALALADALKDFGTPQRLVRPNATGPAVASVPSEPLTPPAPDPTAVEQAVATALLEQQGRLEAEHAEAIEALSESHRQEIERLRAEYGENAGATIANALAAMEERLTSLTSSVVARILGIAVTEDVQAKAVEALAKSVTDAVRDSDAVKIRVSGPLSLFETLQPKLGRHAEQVEFSESSSLDLTVSIDDALYETRLSEWSGALTEILA